MWKKENLRKNFLRVKQMADQNLGRAEKSEVLTEDQQGNERRVEVVRQVSHNLIKKVGALLEAPGTDYDKRLKKLPETGLSHTFTESAGMLGPDTLLGSICQQCGDCQAVLATKELQCEIDIENKVLTPLQTIAEIDIPSIMKHRKQLAKSTLDMDSAKSRFNSAVRQSQAQGTNMASAAAKADALRDEHDEACNRVEAIKDNLSIELCNFVARESEHSARLVALLEAQATYHKNALKVIEDAIPKMKATIEKSPLKPVFGMALEEHLKMMGRDVSLVLEACILTLIDIGMEEEGLFRIAGSALKLKKLRACIDAHALDMEEFSNEPHTVAGVLKQYLRELPEPLMTYNLCKEFMDASQLPPDQRFKSLQAIVNKLPPANYNNIRYLVKFLQLLAEKSQINKMTPSNIAIVMGPNLLWAKGESAPNMMTTGAVSSIIESFIIHADQFFPGDFDFNETGAFSPDSPGQDFRHDNPVMTASSPSVLTHSTTPNSGSPVPNSASPAANSLSPANDSPEGPQTSPKVQRRLTKKPAPPPPPDRSYTVAVTASMSKATGNGGLTSMTWHRSAPLNSPQPSADQAAYHHGEGDRRHSPPERRTSGHERPHGPPPERPERPSAPPPERPKAPPTLQTGTQHPPGAPGGHQRSASTGAMHIITTASPSPVTKKTYTSFV
ncbi:rho GTPase-activating protein 17-like isoform X5 [Littorina saxatilis]|uniref:rho GTPase-activating protein 17-like isoform X5 n=1 Tax=Littorina saxatilis TaxID=31220 RepID=UPI0038B610A4